MKIPNRISEQEKQTIKNRLDLFALVSKHTDLKRVATTDGGEWAGPCPSCGGTDRFRVWPNSKNGPHFWCRNGVGNGCGFAGDCFSFVQTIEGLTFPQALRRCAQLAGVTIAADGQGLPVRQRRPARPTSYRGQGKIGPPPQKWQATGWAFVNYAQKYLWSPAGEEALNYLFERGLTAETIEVNGIGYNPEPRRSRPDKWGDPDPNAKAVWLPRGWVFPWQINGKLWRINVRRRDGDLRHKHDAKILGPRGYSPGLYLADDLRKDRPAVLVEGEITALTIKQVAEDLVSVVATGGTTHARQELWVARLALCPLVMVSFDNDGHDGLDGKPATKGNGAAKWWTRELPNAKRWRPLWGDPNDMLQAGADVRKWVEAGLRHWGHLPHAEALPIKKIIWPADKALLLDEEHHRMLPDGQVEVAYFSEAELAAHLYTIQLVEFAGELGGVVQDPSRGRNLLA